ncbi:hypothetical protein COU57_04105 [Candidatus Pacearchaeota archaeon CG10_big_fil_rev_8_21_14_0_10_32_14]|nr:MAG: hypothetical protein COU57_04105 [Candidatus Pacearchaeota archaeon CG10_big_fil_rev_8_21_14_0_10_32_14]
MKILVDAYAWIEYLNGSSEGEKVHKILQGSDECLTLSITLCEVISKVKRNKCNFEIAYEAIHSNSRTIDPTPIMSKEGGLIHAKMREKIKNFGLVDSLLLACAKHHDAKILTSDNHFKGFKEVIFLK